MADTEQPQPNVPRARWEAVLDAMMQSGDLQLECSDGSLTVHSQVLMLASPEELAGAVEAARGQVPVGSATANTCRALPSVKVCVHCCASC